MLSKKILNNVAMDLQRAAVAFWFRPEGKTSRVFLRHARQIAGRYSRQISQLERQASRPPVDRQAVINLADKMLTLGCLLRE